MILRKVVLAFRTSELGHIPSKWKQENGRWLRYLMFWIWEGQIA